MIGNKWKDNCGNDIDEIDSEVEENLCLVVYVDVLLRGLEANLEIINDRIRREP